MENFSQSAFLVKHQITMLSRISSLLGVTSPSSSSGLGREDITPCCPGRGDALLVFTGWVGSSGFLPQIDFAFASSRLLEGVESFSPNTENGLVSVIEASGFPAVDVRQLLRLNSVEEAGFENITFFFFEAGVTHSPDSDSPVISIGYVGHEYRRRIVDANVIGVATRGCSGGNGSDELASRRESRDVGKKTRHNQYMFFGADLPKAHLETFPACMSVPRIPQGQPSYQRTLQIRD